MTRVFYIESDFPILQNRVYVMNSNYIDEISKMTNGRFQLVAIDNYQSKG